MNRYEQIFNEFLHLTEFELCKHDDGFGVYDLQGVDLGEISYDRFDNAGQLIERMEVYIEDYIVEDLQEQLIEAGRPDIAYDTWADLAELARPLLPDCKYEIDMLDMLCNHFDEIDLNRVFEETRVNPEQLYEATDLQGGGFGEDRQLTVEGWREQAMDWADMDDDEGTYEYMQLLRADKVLDYIAENWSLRFSEVNEE